MKQLIVKKNKRSKFSRNMIDFLGKKQFVFLIVVKMFFKVGIEEIMKFSIGVIINSMGEVFVGDTGNYVVRVYNSEGKYFRDIGKEV